MTIDILTLFPNMFKGPFDESIIKRAVDKNLLSINIHNLRKWATDKHKTVDDKPYGGGEGMILKVEPVFRAVQQLKDKFSQTQKRKRKKGFSHVILTSPAGRKFNHRIAKKLSDLQHIIIICGHYEGVDQRIFNHIADERLCIGDYILTGGELPAMVIVDAVSRLIPGVLGKEASRQAESFSYQKSLLKYPQYTRPEEFEGMKVPEILTSGNHKEIEKWRKEKAKELTEKYRPDLISKPKQ
ncbi:tRNA (guanosine(37)-N1)-methyltransferase TrmD [candidate division CPR3 bacterium 4484_211]|uniref:tRNA (guanine-N(1)-)-methyltransferase n=1 Tax=candidate division CPR3 bacterium 4484_211 TaxID=1968527 RepID=A0A1W9NZ53_UNCC3|nr:MAG: tRNA (guanosine(37)-N1)-methyltransferase TrmD [candidate division CPR3 bacterium 4484_211]